MYLCVLIRDQLYFCITSIYSEMVPLLTNAQIEDLIPVLLPVVVDCVKK